MNSLGRSHHLHPVSHSFYATFMEGGAAYRPPRPILVDYTGRLLGRGTVEYGKQHAKHHHMRTDALTHTELYPLHTACANSPGSAVSNVKT